MASPPPPPKKVVPERPHKAIGAAPHKAPPGNHHIKNLFGAVPAAEAAPAEAMKNLNLGKKMATGGLVGIANKLADAFLREYNITPKKMAHGGTITEGPVLRRPTHHGMSGPTSFQPHYKGMSHSVKPVGQSFAQASFAQGGYFPGADHRLI